MSIVTGSEKYPNALNTFHITQASVRSKYMKMKNITFIIAGFLSLFMFSCQKQNDSIEALLPTESAGIINNLTTSGPKRVLFDAKHAQTAGNADWVIDQDNSTPQRIPTPFQSNITASTAETYWTGGISAWGIALVKLGLNVETLPSTGSLTYGVSTNAQDLLKYDVLVLDEPNTRFTTAEKTAIVNFVRDGGGLFIISNHSGADRNNDGWDPPAILNDLMNSNSVAVNPFGFSIDLANFSQTSTNVTSLTHPITRGTQGNVTGLKFSSGTSITLSSGGTARGLIWMTGFAQSTTRVMAAYSTYGTGRVVIIGDSSPADDGTGAPNNTLYPGWTELSGNHSRLHLNATLWLAKLQ